ncbi:hypothetical protein ACOTCL_28910 [Achromobacter xylosoxidans]
MKTSPSKSKGFELTLPDAMPRVFADDLCHLMLGMPNSKLVFHATPADPLSVSKGGESPDLERREGVLQLTMPTAALFNLARHILAAASENTDQIVTAHNRYGQFCQEVLKGVTIAPEDQES